MSIFSRRKRICRLTSLAISAVATSLCSSQVALCLPFEVKISEFLFDSENMCFYILCFDMSDVSRTIEKKMTIDKYKCYFTSDCCDFVKKFPPQNCCAVEDKTIDLNSPVDVKRHLDELKQKFMDKFGEQISKRRLLQYIRDNNCESNPEFGKEISTSNSVDILVDDINQIEKRKLFYHYTSPYTSTVDWSVDEIKEKFMEMANIKTIQKSYNDYCRGIAKQPTGLDGAMANIKTIQKSYNDYCRGLAKQPTGLDGAMANIKTIQKSYNDYCRGLAKQSAGSSGANEQKKICYEIDTRDPAFEDKLRYFAVFVSDFIRYKLVERVSGPHIQIESKVNVTKENNMVYIEVTL